MPVTDRARAAAAVLGIVLVALALRTVWLRADPPTYSTGVVWHDEGAWTHNARNQALWGVWVTDNWNPVFIAPVFTAMEYAAFEIFGVGTWQARTVPVASGMIALLALIAGLGSLSGSRAALVGGLLLAVNFTWVTWNRAALMESTMTMFIVVAWAAYIKGGGRAWWGAIAGMAAVLAWFTKAAAAFFIAALVADAVWTVATARLSVLRERFELEPPSTADVRNACFVLAGLAAAALAIGVLFVWPHWEQYHFYNWQMTVLRKPTYDLESLRHRITWLPIAHDIFSRMWFVLLAGALAVAGILARYRQARPGERLLVLWVVLGLLELVVHDAGNERRYVMFIPALVALAALFAGARHTLLPSLLAEARSATRLTGAAVVSALIYLVAGSLLRMVFENDVEAGFYRTTVRASAAIALVGGVITLLGWRALTARIASFRLPAAAAAVFVAIVGLSDLWQFASWARGRTELIFVGHQFGNYADRLARDDVRYILTYSLPEEGRESFNGLIREILNHYPQRRVIATFDVQETPAVDQAVLIDKRPFASGFNRAPD
jgi:4-amino-4-deoxy-L-arabinose transferase-like glycosyltransferase